MGKYSWDTLIGKISQMVQTHGTHSLENLPNGTHSWDTLTGNTRKILHGAAGGAVAAAVLLLSKGTDLLLVSCSFQGTIARGQKVEGGGGRREAWKRMSNYYIL